MPVFVKHLGLWQRGQFVRENTNGTIRVRISRLETVDVKAHHVERVQKD